MSAKFFKDIDVYGEFNLAESSTSGVNFGHREAVGFVADNEPNIPTGAVTVKNGKLIYVTTGLNTGYYVGIADKTSGVTIDDWKRLQFVEETSAHSRTHQSQSGNVNSVAYGTIGADPIYLDALVPQNHLSMKNGGISYKITDLADPSLDTDAATKSYVDAARAGLNIKEAVRVATTALLTCSTYTSGVLTTSTNNITTLDGVTLVLNDRVLVKDNVTCTNPLVTNSAVYNGVYIVSQVSTPSLPLKLTRAADFDGVNKAIPNTNYGSGVVFNGEVKTGATVWVDQGSTNAGKRFALITGEAIAIDTTPLVFAVDFAAKDIVVGNGMNYTTPNISVKPGNGISVNVDGVNVKPNPTNPTIAVDSNGVKVNFNAAQFQATTNGLELKSMMKSYCKKVELTSVNMANSKISGSGNNVIAHGLQCDSGTSTVDVTPTTVDFYDKKGNQVFFEVITLSTTQVTFTSTTNITLGAAGSATNIFMVTSYVG